MFSNHFGAINRAAVAIVIAAFHHWQLNLLRYAIMHIVSSVINVFSPLDACMFAHTASYNWLYFSFVSYEGCWNSNGVLFFWSKNRDTFCLKLYLRWKREKKGGLCYYYFNYLEINRIIAISEGSTFKKNNQWLKPCNKKQGWRRNLICSSFMPNGFLSDSFTVRTFSLIVFTYK